MKLRFSSLFSLLAVLSALCLTPPAAAQLSSAAAQLSSRLGFTNGQEADQEKSVAELRQQAEADLDEVRKKLEENTAIQPVDAAAAADKEERQRLLDVLLYFRNEKLWRLNELEAQQNAAPPPVANLPAVKALGTAAPYSLPRVDALRDELDAQKDRLHALQSNLKIWEGEKQFLHDRLRKANEQARLATDKAAYDKTETSRRSQEIADLKKQVAEVELSTRVISQDHLQAQIDALKPQIEEIGRIAASVIPKQQLSEGELAERRATLREAQEKVSAEIDQIAVRHAKRLAERERLIAANPTTKADPARLAFVNQALHADGMALEGLRSLQLLEQFSANAWEQRLILLSDDSDAKAKQNAIEALRQIAATLNEKESHWQQLTVAQKNLRSTIADLEARISRQPDPGSAQAVQDKEILALYRDDMGIYERVAQSMRRIGQETTRWLGDFAGDTAGNGSDTAKRSLLDAWLTTKQAVYSIWNYELFAVEDVSQVDGKKITVSYGVTIGKSIGAFLLFILGYWLFARISKRILKILVENGSVDAQVAVVTRRWLMISVAILLAIAVLNLARIPLTVFTFIGGALAIGVGFGTQTIIKNFISGIILLFERKVRVGDIIVIDDIIGTVSSVDLRATTVKAFDGVEALIPNSNVLENQIINWTYSDSLLRREIRLRVKYGTSVRKAAQIMLSCAQEHGQVIRTPEPEVYLEEFAESSLNLTMIFWVDLAAGTNGRRVDSDLRFMIEKRMSAAGLPFPTREVNLNAGHPLSVMMAEAGTPEMKGNPASESQGEQQAQGTHTPTGQAASVGSPAPTAASTEPHGARL